jgi:UDP-N-acetylglucosamine 2-epimerase (non-hydrolysing)
MRVVSVVGTRPNFMKLAPVARALAVRGTVTHVIVHTGQHYDAGMSAAFFDDLAIPLPDHNLEVGSGPHGVQTGLIMQRLEPLLAELRPDTVLVYGDVNSTMAAALVAAKLGIGVGHVEAGLRSRDWTMPEEINRVVTDRVADLLFAPSRDAVESLRAEGVPPERIHFVGNVMIDTLCWTLPRAQALDPAGRRGLAPGGYAVATLHRPSNVDDPATLRELVATLAELGRRVPVVFPIHPRTRARLLEFGVDGRGGGEDGLRLCEPLGYVEMLGLVAAAAVVVTDSGGLQEETTYLGIPCLTVRPNTERPVTCLHGTNRLVPTDQKTILAAASRALARRAPARPVLERWDGRAAERIVSVLCDGADFPSEPAPLAASDSPRGRRAAAIPQMA